MIYSYEINGLRVETGDLICTTSAGEDSIRGQFWRPVGMLIPGAVDHIVIYVGPKGRCVEAGAKLRVITFNIKDNIWDASKMMRARGPMMDAFYGVAYPLAGKRIDKQKKLKIRENVASYCLRQAKAEKPYNLFFVDSKTEKAFYCSQLAYKAYLREGIGHGRQRSARLTSFGIFLYMLGPSYRDVAKCLKMLGCRGSKSSIERDVAAAGQKAKALHLQGLPARVRVLGVDGTGAKIAGDRKQGLLFFTDIEQNKLICVEPVNEKDAQKVREHVLGVMREVGAEQLRTDELSVYEHIVPEEHHSICLAHWRKSKCRRAYELYRRLKAEGLEFEAENMWQLLQLLRAEPRSATLPEPIERLVRRYINCRRSLHWKVNQLLQHIERTWQRVSSEGADRTNNATERIIGLDYKIRAKTMRGFKSIDKSLGHCYLSEFLRGNESVCDLRKVV